MKPDLNFKLDEDTTGWQVPCLVYSRIVGYLTPVQQWNLGKAQEFNERVAFAVQPVLDAYEPQPSL